MDFELKVGENLKKIFYLSLFLLLVTISVTFSMSPNYANDFNRSMTIGNSGNSITKTSTISYTAHTPISISSNTAFNGAGFTGTGTSTDPYVLNDYYITSTTSDAISITTTSAYFIISNCYISTNGTNYFGVSLNSVGNGTFENDYINNSGSSGGFYSNGGSNILLMNSTINKSSGNGLDIETSNLITVYNNTIINSQNSGIYSLSNTNSTFTYNNVSYNDLSNGASNYGIYDWGYSTNVTYSYNIVNNNGNDGFWLYQSGKQMITFNTVENNQGNGIYFGFGGPQSDVNVSNNYVAYNTQDGLNLDQASNNSISNNIIVSNTGNGVNVGHLNVNNYFNNNTITNNDLAGFLIDASSVNVTVVGNTIDGSHTDGLNLTSAYNLFTGNSSFVNNTITNSGNDGIYVNSTNNDTFSYNYVALNSGYGVYVHNSTENTFYLNSFVNNYIQGSDANTTNSWTNGHYGNYWSDYLGTDANNDGIGDSNYTLNGIGVANDTLPLMFPNVFSLKSAPNLSFNQGTQNHILKWNITGYDTINYAILVNNNQVGSFNGLIVNGSWLNSFPVDYLSLGTYTVKLVVTDVNMSLQTQTSSVVTVIDVTAPTLSVSPTSLTYVQGTNGHTISINASDINRSSYVVYENGTQIASGSWSSKVNIMVSVDGLSVGGYNFTAVVFDTSGNHAQVTVMITVTPAPTNTTGTTSSQSSTGSNTGSTGTSSHTSPGFETIITLLSLSILVTFYFNRRIRNS